MAGAQRLGPNGWGSQHTPRCAGRHILAIQDSSEFNFTTTRERSRGLGEIGKRSGRGVLLHAMLGVLMPKRAAFRAWARTGYGHAMAG